jgi:hypothetical protein
MNMDDLVAIFIASTPHGVMIADPDGVIRFWKPHAHASSLRSR